MLYSCKDGSFYSFIIKNSKTYSTLKERNTWEILLVVNIKINSQLLQINHFYLKKKKAAGFKSLRQSWDYSGNKKISYASQFSCGINIVSYSVIFLKKKFITDVLKEAFLKTCVSCNCCKICGLFRTAIPTNNWGQLLLYCLFH